MEYSARMKDRAVAKYLSTDRCIQHYVSDAPIQYHLIRGEPRQEGASGLSLKAVTTGSNFLQLVPVILHVRISTIPVFPAWMNNPTLVMTCLN
jgi:hypothetical protein